MFFLAPLVIPISERRSGDRVLVGDSVPVLGVSFLFLLAAVFEVRYQVHMAIRS
jgi:hypothetical protein